MPRLPPQLLAVSRASVMPLGNREGGATAVTREPGDLPSASRRDKVGRGVLAVVTEAGVPPGGRFAVTLIAARSHGPLRLYPPPFLFSPVRAGRRRTVAGRRPRGAGEARRALGRHAAS